MKLIVSTPFKANTYEDITLLNLPGISGQLGVLNNHAPMIVLLKAGTITMADKGTLTIRGGTAFISPLETIVMTDHEVTHVL